MAEMTPAQRAAINESARRLGGITVDDEETGLAMIQLALRACPVKTPQIHGSIVAAVYGHMKHPDAVTVQAKLNSIIDESCRIATASPWVE